MAGKDSQQLTRELLNNLGPKTTIWRLLYRWFSGRPLGKRMTDSGFIRPASAHIDQYRQVPSAWMMWPGWKRSVVRQVCAFVALWTLYQWWTGHTRTIVIAYGIALGVCAVGGSFLLYRVIRDWKNYRERVRPLAYSLRGVVGWPVATQPNSWISVPSDLGKNPDAQVCIKLPLDNKCDTATRKLITDIATSRLALEDPEFTFQLAGQEPHVLIRPALQPPKKVGYSDVLPFFDGLKADEVVVGLGIREKPVTLSLATEPHILLSLTTGAGKSTFIGYLVAQLQYLEGALVIVLDPKRTSLMHLRNQPGVVYCSTPQQMHEACLAAAKIADDRYTFIEQTNDEHACDNLPRILVIVEEANMLADQLQDYWREIKPQGAPIKSPAIRALAKVLFTGRACRENVICAAQYGLAAVTGGSAGRECFGGRFLKGSPAQWKLLAPEVKPAPKKPKVRGRVHLIEQDTARIVQFPYLTSGELRDIAVQAREKFGYESTMIPRDVPELLSAHGLDTFELSSAGQKALPAERDADLLSLAEAVQAGGPLEGMSLEAVRKASQRNGFPEPAERGDGPSGQRLYDREELFVWMIER